MAHSSDREMRVIELLASVVAQDPDSEHMLAVLAHAWQAIGLPLNRLIVRVARANGWARSHAWDVIEHAFYEYPKSKRRADSRMLREMIRLLDEAGIITDAGLSDARDAGRPEIGPWCLCGAGEFQPPEMHSPPCPGVGVRLSTPFTQPEIVEIYGKGYA